MENLCDVLRIRRVEDRVEDFMWCFWVLLMGLFPLWGKRGILRNDIPNDIPYMLRLDIRLVLCRSLLYSCPC